MKHTYVLLTAFFLAGCSTSGEPAPLTNATSSGGGFFLELICIGWCKQIGADAEGETTISRPQVRPPGSK